MEHWKIFIAFRNVDVGSIWQISGLRTHLWIELHPQCRKANIRFKIQSDLFYCNLEKYIVRGMITAKNTVISPNFLVSKFCGKAQFPHSFPETVRKLSLSTKFSHQDIRWNYGIFHSGSQLHIRCTNSILCYFQTKVYYSI